MRSDIDKALLDITIRARIDRSAIHRLQIAGQRQRRLRRSLLRVNDRHLWKQNGAGLHDLARLTRTQHARNNANRQKHDEHSDATEDTCRRLGGRVLVCRSVRHYAFSCSPPWRLPWTRLYIRGTKNRVAKVAIERPPMTARASGAFCSPPSPMPSAIGSMPTIIAKAVMMIGRSRVDPAETAAAKADRPRALSSLAKVTSRIELAVATPIDMMAPIRLGTLKVDWVRNSAHTIPQKAPGRAQMM